MSVREYPLHRLHGTALVYEDGQWVRVEPYEGYFTLTWTSPLSAAAAVRVVRDVAPVVFLAAKSGIMLRGGSALLEHTSAFEVLKAAEWDAHLEFFRTESSDIAFVWMSPEQQLDGDLGRWPTIGLISKIRDAQAISALLESTGTPAVIEHAAELVERVVGGPTGTPMPTEGDSR